MVAADTHAIAVPGNYQTEKSGCASFTPDAIEVRRPSILWKPYVFM